MRILLVEDDEVQANDIARLLTRGIPAATVEVIATESAFRANFEAIAADPPHLAILDVMLRWGEFDSVDAAVPDDVLTEGPLRAGVRVHRMLAAHDATRLVPVIFYSALHREALRDYLRQCPEHVLFTPKSAHPRSLVAAARSLIAASPALAADLRERASRSAARVFISYAHKDRRWLDEIKLTLRPMLRDEQFTLWDDTGIEAGDRWREAIDQNLRSASVAILLVSRHYFASDFIANNELPPLLDAAARQGVRIVWIAVGASQYESTPIREYQAANDPGRPLDSLPEAELGRELIRIANVVRRALGLPEPA